MITSVLFSVVLVMTASWAMYIMETEPEIGLRLVSAISDLMVFIVTFGRFNNLSDWVKSYLEDESIDEKTKEEIRELQDWFD